MRRRPPTEEQKKAAAERRQRFKTLAKQISGMADAERDALAAKMLFLTNCEGHTLSMHNRCLIASQMPIATMVGGFQQWRKAGRCVRKGEHGLMIWIPLGPRGEQQEDQGQDTKRDPDKCRFIIGTVFDVSQTDEITAGAALQEATR